MPRLFILRFAFSVLHFALFPANNQSVLPFPPDRTMMTRVFLLRHAETANPLVFHGAESDVALSPRGQRQAEAVARVLAGDRPDVVISSAMRRARDTAVPIARAA